MDKRKIRNQELTDEYGDAITFLDDGVVGDHILDVNDTSHSNKYGEKDESYYNQYSNRFV